MKITNNNRIGNTEFNNSDLSNLDRLSKDELLNIYFFGLENPNIVNSNNEFLKIMDTLRSRFSSGIKDYKENKLLKRKIKYNDGFIEVGEFKNIVLLTDDLEPLGDTQNKDIIQDSNLNEEYNIYNMLEYKNKFEQILLNFCKEGKSYKMVFKVTMVNVNIREVGDIQTRTTNSFFIHRHSNIEYILIKFSNLIIDLLFQYQVADKININIFVKEWLDSSELKNISSLYSILDRKENQIVATYKKNKLEEVKLDKTQRALLGITRKNKSSVLVKGTNYGTIVNSEEILSKYEIKDYDSLILNESSFSTNLSKKSSIFSLEKDNNKIDGIRKEGFEVKPNELLDVKYYKLPYSGKNSNKEYIIKVSNVDNITNEVSAYIEVIENNIKKLIKIEEWTDKIEYSSENMVCFRKIKGTPQEMLFVNNNLKKVEFKYSCKLLEENRMDLDRNLKIGSFDFETYLDKDNNAIPYYIGCRTGNKRLFYKYSDYLNVDDMVLKFILDLMVIENHNRFYYAHNLSDFDGMFVLKSLINTSNNHALIIKALTKNDGTLISLEIKKKLSNNKLVKITLLDSLHLLPFSLMELGKVFKSKDDFNNTGKGFYPHDFINKQGIDLALNYKGVVPDIKYFNGISTQEYQKEIVHRINKYENGVWDSEKELIKYLTKDIDTLYNIMNTFGEFIFSKFNINITRIRTYSGLAYLIYTSKYYESKKVPIYLTTGKIDSYIRNGYYGGIVDSWTFYSDKKLWKYDIKSHYPNQMRNNPMPGGLPRFSNETNLDCIFGFVRAEVTAPLSSDLRVAILPIKGNNGELITFRGVKEGIWFSEELKNAVKYGYKVKVKDCVLFDKVYNVFDGFVNEFYNLKTQAELEKDLVSRLIYKLLLNSLSGRWGLRDLNTEMKIVDSKNLNILNKTENVDVLFTSKRLSFVKSHGVLDPDVVDLFRNENLIEKPKNQFNGDKDKPWGKNNSAVQLSAAITAYGRIYMSQFKNIHENLYFGGDTDSFILEKPLDSSMVGKNLGQAELEQIIVEAFFHSKKSYLIVNDKNETIIKMKGINKANSVLNYELFTKLFKGEDVKIKQLEFRKDYKNLNVKIHYITKTIKGISDINIINYIKTKYN
uniref:Probable DNA polymerase n=1 Tax=Calocybe gambosa TaxID=56469 RepID=A0A8F1D512_9AGAR|nr:DNA polymerase [Calocybe gambosa]